MPNEICLKSPPLDFLTGKMTGHFRSLSGDRLNFMYQCMLNYGEFVELKLGPIKTYILSHPPSVEWIQTKNARNYSKDTPGFRLMSKITGKGVFTENGESWKNIRKVVQPFFTKKNHPFWSAMVQEAARQISDEIGEKTKNFDKIDIAPYMTKVTLSVLGLTLFNEDLGRHEKVMDQHLSKLISITEARIGRGPFVPFWIKNREEKDFLHSASTLDKIILDLINSSKKKPLNPDQNFVHAFLAINPDFPDQFLVDQVKTLVFAGHETTSSALSWTLYHLTKYPDWYKKVEEEMENVLGKRQAGLDDLDKLKVLRMVVNETMRMYPPAWSWGRMTEGDDEILGVKVKKGDLFLISPFLLHNNPKYWNNPREFNPLNFTEENTAKRHPYSFIPFSAGPRACIGESLSYMELLIILPTLLQKFHFEAVPGHNVEMEAKLTIKPKNGLPLLIRKKQ